MTTEGSSRSSSRVITQASVAMSTRGSASGWIAVAIDAGIDGRQITLKIDDHVMAPVRVEPFQRLEDA